MTQQPYEWMRLECKGNLVSDPVHGVFLWLLLLVCTQFCGTVFDRQCLFLSQLSFSFITWIIISRDHIKIMKNSVFWNTNVSLVRVKTLSSNTNSIFTLQKPFTKSFLNCAISVTASFLPKIKSVLQYFPLKAIGCFAGLPRIVQHPFIDPCIKMWRFQSILMCF